MIWMMPSRHDSPMGVRRATSALTATALTRPEVENIAYGHGVNVFDALDGRWSR